ncbi:heme-binding domain-containing protein [Flavobacteriaceae bacterium]|nr:heme-binding domain-containing protein [Flavobacteriaceae bacterium]
MTRNKKIISGLVIVFVIAQFFQPTKNQGNLEPIALFLVETQASNEVKQILKHACFDCHSSVTNYPWYNAITPVNYWLNGHVKEGKKHFNVSKWASYSVKKKDHKLEELIEELEAQEMPLASYTWTHKEAQLTDVQVQSLVDWARNARSNYSLDTDNN